MNTTKPMNNKTITISRWYAPRNGASLLLAAMLCLLPPVAMAQGAWESLASIRSVASKFVLATIGDPQARVRFDHLDPRLRLRRCDGQLEAFWPGARRPSGNATVGVRCNGSRAWKIYLPVRITRRLAVVVTRHPLARQHPLTLDDLRVETREVSGLDAVPMDPQHYVGMVTRRRLPAGEILRPQLVQPPRVIRRGDPVIIEARSGNIAVRVHGTALMDGRRGQRIRVKNASSGRVIQASVAAAGLVTVGI